MNDVKLKEMEISWEIERKHGGQIDEVLKSTRAEIKQALMALYAAKSEGKNVGVPKELAINAKIVIPLV